MSVVDIAENRAVIRVAAFLPDPDKRYVEYVTDLDGRTWHAWTAEQQIDMTAWLVAGVERIAAEQQTDLAGATWVGHGWPDG